MQDKFKAITLCGSTKFKEQFIAEQKRLTLEGNIVISVDLFGHSGDNEVWNDDIKNMLDEMHKRKIDMADEIFIINVDGYIGTSTWGEIEYAKLTNKPIKYLVPERNNTNNQDTFIKHANEVWNQVKENIKNNKELSDDDAVLIIEEILDTLIEVGNGVTDEMLHESADLLFAFRDKWMKFKINKKE